MLEYIDFTVDFKKRNTGINGLTLDRTVTRSLDTAVRFRIEIIGRELDESYSVKLLSKYHDSQSQTLFELGDNLEIVDGKLVYTPSVDFITQSDFVSNYLYISKGGLSLDVARFNYSVDLSEIDKSAWDIKQVYDQSYADLLAEFEVGLQEYRDSLPQASALRAEIDDILNRFSADSVAKLNQYDADAQQVIADNQTAYDSAESGRQSTYEQAEDSRNQASEQAVSDFEHLADESLGVKLGEIQTIADSAIDQIKQDGDAEIADWREYADGELAEALADRVVLKNLVANGDFRTGITGWTVAPATAEDLESGISFAATQRYGGVNKNIVTSVFNGQKLYLFSRVKTDSSGATLLNNSNPGLSTARYTGGGDWQLLSFVHDQPINATRFRPEVRDESLSIFLPIEVEYIGAINLTQTFGAGKEPTKTEMDELIKITGYFDEITLTQKQLLNWQLRLMRQNRNALIALGGTII